MTIDQISTHKLCTTAFLLFSILTVSILLFYTCLLAYCLWSKHIELHKSALANSTAYQNCSCHFP